MTETIIAGLPRWVWDVVAALQQYEDDHPKLFRDTAANGFQPTGWGCVSHVLEMVPSSTLDISRALTEAGVFENLPRESA